MPLVAMVSMVVPVYAVPLDVQLKTQTGSPAVDAGVYAVSKVAVPLRGRREAIIEQVDKQFKPQVTIVQTGTSLNFPNRDPIRHHVYSFSPAKTFEIKLYSGVPAHPVVFDKAGEITLGCNIHDHMIAWVLVVDTPYFAKSDATGSAKLDLPPGEYEIRAWFPGATTQPLPRKVVVGSSTVEPVTFNSVSRFGPQPK